MSWHSNVNSDEEEINLANMTQRKSSSTSTASKRILERFPGRIPVIVERLERIGGGGGSWRKGRGGKSRSRSNATDKAPSHPNPPEDSLLLATSKSAEDFHRFRAQCREQARQKFLVPHDCTVGQFQAILRRKIALNESMAIFLTVEQTLPHASCLLGELYRDFQSPDGFLYIRYSEENTFGYILKKFSAEYFMREKN